MNQKNIQLARLAIGLSLCLGGFSLCLPVKSQVIDSNQSTQVTNFASDYIVGAGDQLRLDIFQVDEYSGEYLVLVDGTMSMPLIGSVAVAGLTLEQISELVALKYSNYLKRPLVTVSLQRPRPLKISVAGEIANPGSYTIDWQESQKIPTVTDLIQMAGGLTTFADISQIQVRRQAATGEQIITINLWELINQGNLQQDISLRDGDRIMIASKTEIDARENQQLANLSFGIQAREALDVTIIGEIYRPGVYEVAPEENPTTGKSEPPNLSAAISKAGGIKPLADIRNIEIHRLTRTGEIKIIAVDLWQLLQEGDIQQDLLLEEGDKIVIPTAQQLSPEEASSLATASFAPDTIEVKVVGEVMTPGTIKLPPNSGLNQAILAAGGFDQMRAKTGAVELIRLNPDGTVSQRQIDVDFTENLSEENNPPLRSEDVIVVKTSGTARAIDTLSTVFSPLRILPIWPFFR